MKMIGDEEGNIKSMTMAMKSGKNTCTNISSVNLSRKSPLNYHKMHL